MANHLATIRMTQKGDGSPGKCPGHGTNRGRDQKRIANTRNVGGLAAKVLPAEYVIAILRMHQSEPISLHLRNRPLRVL